jgi:hypothetical protein
MSTATLSRAAPRNGSPAPKFQTTRGVLRAAHGTVVYGTGGIGKSSLASLLPGVLMIDLASETNELDVSRVTGIGTWADLLDFLTTADFSDTKAIAIDNGSKAEDLCRSHVIANVKTDKNGTATSLESYGWGKGPVYLFEEWRKFLAALDVHRNAGRDVILICHERVGKVPNPSGDDYIRYEPRLYTDTRVSLMHATKEWANHVLFVSYDVAAKDGKAKGSGTRTIYCAETATYMAKSRTLDGTPIEFTKGDGSIWEKLKNPAVAVGTAPDL